MRVDVELELPVGEHRDRLLDALGNLVRRRGFETFVSAPILLPHSAYFPERWERSVRGARQVLRRLMHYAGLGDLTVNLESWRERPVIQIPGGLAPQHAGNHAAAWFAGIHDGTCAFGLELDQLRHEPSLVATLAHEVAHAFRDHHRLIISDRELEEKLTDLTCVYLGFGAFTLNASHVVETGGVGPSGEKMLFETRSLGYLSPGELALLLAVQLAVRADPVEQRAVRKELLPNHAALVRSGLESFADQRDELVERLGIPGPTQWPSRFDLTKLAPLPDEDVPEDAGTHGDRDAGSDRDPIDARGGVVFRVKRDRSAGLALIGLVATAAAGVAVGAGTFTFYAACALAFTGGIAVGRRIRADECSGCRARLSERDERCNACGGRVAAEIATHEDRLDAEERLNSENDAVSYEDEDAPDDPLSVLFTAMLAAWAIERGMLADDASEDDRELARRVRAQEFDTEALHAAWRRGGLLADEALDFAEDYWTRRQSTWTNDVTALGTANELDDRPTNYQRFAKILDRRFEEWREKAKNASE